MANEGETLQTVRIPFGQEEDQRLQSGRATAYSYGAYDQSFVNCYPVGSKDPLRNDTTNWNLVTRYGFNNPQTGTWSHALPNPSASYPVAVLALTTIPNVVIVAFTDDTTGDTTLYEMDDQFNMDRIAVINTLTNPNVFLTELLISNNPNICIVLDDGTTSEVWYAAASSGTFSGVGVTQITDADFPTELTPARRIIGPAVQMNGYTFVIADDGYIYNSDLDSISSWDTAGNLEVTSQPDNVLRLIRYKHHLLVFGTSSIEFFNFDPGTVAPDSPLTSTDQAYINFGTIGTMSVINIDDTIYWIAASKDGALGMWKLEGYTPVQVSGPYHSSLLQQQGAGANLQVIQMHGMRHIITNIVGNHNIGYLPSALDAYSPSNLFFYGSLCLCVDTKTWWFMAFEDSTLGSSILTTRMIEGNVQLAWPQSSYGLAPTVAYPNTPVEKSYSGYDSFLSSSLATQNYYRIPMAFFSNVFDFGTATRKSLFSATIVGDVMHQASAYNYPDFLLEDLNIYFCASWNDGAYLSSTEWRIREQTWEWPASLSAAEATGSGLSYDYPSLRRIRFNNLGHARNWKFAMFVNTYCPIRWNALELVVRMGAH